MSLPLVRSRLFGAIALGMALAAGATGTVSPARAEGLAELPEDCVPQRLEMIPATPWEQARLQVERVHQISTGAGVVVGVIDTGVDLRGYQFTGQNEDGTRLEPTVHALVGRNLVPDVGEPINDCDGHGTFVAGIIAGQKRPTSDFVGLAPDATIYPSRYATAHEDDQADASTEDLAGAIRLAVEDGVDVINVSSVTTSDVSALREAIEFAEANDVVVVAAVGNSGDDGNPVTYPANYPSVIGVGAVAQDGSVAGFSQTSVPVSVVAPGVEVTGPATGHGLYRDSGTSFAAPFVAATAALVRAVYPDLPAAEVKRRIERTADHPGRDLPDEQYGWGIVNPYRAITAVLPAETDAPRAAAEQTGPRYVPPPPPDHTNRNIALVVAGGAALAVVVMFAVVATYRRGRARRWRSSSWATKSIT